MVSLEDRPIIYKCKYCSMPKTRPEDFGRKKMEDYTGLTASIVMMKEF